MPVNDELGRRMKQNYEQRARTYLTRRMPVAIRIDGKAFHTFTRGFQKPFDEVLGNAMVKTMQYLCENIQGCVFGYTQSDEITLILVDYQTFASDAWFDYQVQKICSIAGSMATMAFNRFFVSECSVWFNDTVEWGDIDNFDEHTKNLFNAYTKACEKGAMFDARCFNIPKEEVTNLVYWRQLDATRNSIQMVGQANFSHKELQGKSCNKIQDMLMEQKGINWNDFPIRWKRGVAMRKFPGEPTIKKIEELTAFGDPLVKEITTRRWDWRVDYNMPILKGENRKYVDEVIFVGE